MTEAEWRKNRVIIVDSAAKLSFNEYLPIGKIIMQLDTHFQTLTKLAPTAKGKSTGRPKKHINLGELAELIKQKKSLREIGKSLNVSRETIRRYINAA